MVISQNFDSTLLYWCDFILNFFIVSLCYSQVHAYGFMTDDYQKYSNYYVERHTKTHVVFYANHDYILELNLWKRLHNSKILSLYQRKDTTTEKPKQWYAENEQKSIKNNYYLQYNLTYCFILWKNRECGCCTKQNRNLGTRC